MSVLDNGTAHPVVCFAGSMRYFESIVRYAQSKTKDGYIVLMPFRHPEGKVTDEDKKRYEIMQQERIDMADSLYVINPDNYIGPSTQKEIDYAISKGKAVQYLKTPLKPEVITLCGSWKFIEDFNRIFNNLSLQGKIVHTPAIFRVPDVSRLTEDEHMILDNLHREKMKQSDYVLFVNVGGYMGEDTKAELQWCLDNKIPVQFLENPKN